MSLDVEKFSVRPYIYSNDKISVFLWPGLVGWVKNLSVYLTYTYKTLHAYLSLT